MTGVTPTVGASAQLQAALAILRRHIVPGSRVLVSDGVGMPLDLLTALTEVAREVGGVRLILGWCLSLPPGFDPTAFADVRTFMAGYALRPFVQAGTVQYTPVRLASLPALLEGRWRPDVLITSARHGRSGLTLGTEVSWVQSAVRVARQVIVEINDAMPLATRRDELVNRDVVVATTVSHAPLEISSRTLDDTARSIGCHIARWVCPGSAVQYGPGVIGQAALEQIAVPIRINSGIITDAAVDLAHRRLLIGTPRSGYLVGSHQLYEWADQRRILAGVAELHDLRRLARDRLVGINTALQIDRTGQVGVERVGASPIAGIGGHADYALAASRAPLGLSVIALPTSRGGQSTLVDTLLTATSTPRSDVDIVVTELGSADLRGLSDNERISAISGLWP